jgi:phosphatidylinositol alpha 1,6-mannosyltransferase
VKLRVAIVTESFLPQLNGVTNSVVRVLDSLRANGHEAIVIAPSNGLADLQLDRTYAGFPIVRVPSLPFRQFPVAMPNPFVASILTKFKPDVLHAASPFMLGGAAIGIAKRLGIPTVAVYQTDLAGYAARYGVPFVRAVADKVMTNVHGIAAQSIQFGYDKYISRFQLVQQGQKTLALHSCNRPRNCLSNDSTAINLKAACGNLLNLVVGGLLGS